MRQMVLGSGADGKARMRVTAARISAVQDDSLAIRSAVHPVWNLLEHRKVLQLTGFDPFCMPAILAAHYLDLPALHAANQAAGGSAPTRGTCRQLLEELQGAYGADAALDVAKGAAQDAIVYSTAFYNPVPEGVQVRFLTACRCGCRQRSGAPATPRRVRRRASCSWRARCAAADGRIGVGVLWPVSPGAPAPPPCRGWSVV